MTKPPDMNLYQPEMMFYAAENFKLKGFRLMRDNSLILNSIPCRLGSHCQGVYKRTIDYITN